MNPGKSRWQLKIGLALLAPAAVFVMSSSALQADDAPVIKGEVTFSKDIAPICSAAARTAISRTVAPMSLITYEEVRPWARSIKERTALRDKRGVMPPWYIEKNIGIQQFKNDPSLSDGNREDRQVGRQRRAGGQSGRHAAAEAAASTAPSGTIGEPDLIVSTPEITVKAGAPDWWGEFRLASRPGSPRTAR